MKIGLKIKLLGTGLVLTVTACVLAVMVYRQSILAQRLGELMHKEILQEVALADKDMINLLETQNDTLLHNLEGQLNTARMLLLRNGSPELGEETVSWNAVDQTTKQAISLDLPRLLLGGEWIGKTDQPNRFSPVVDELTKLTGATCTIFQRMNERGDMLRVSTSVLKLDGKRAVGTYIPSSSPVVRALLAGQTYRGRAFVVNDWYLTVYEPISAADGRVIGALYVGIPQTGIASLINAITERSVGSTGHIIVMGAKGRDQGKILVHPDPGMVGKPATEQSPVYEEMTKQVNAAREETLTRTYADATGKKRIAAASLFAPWDWVVVATAPLSDYVATLGHIDNELNRMQFWVLVLSAVIAVAALAVSSLFARSLSRPLKAVVERLESLADGDIRKPTNEALCARKDEIGLLGRSGRKLVAAMQEKTDAARAIAAGRLDVEVCPASEHDELGIALCDMLDTLRQLVGEIQRAADDIAGSSGQVSSATQALSQGATEQAASLEEITSTLTEIGSQTQHNAEHAATANQHTNEASKNAARGNQEMQRLLEAMSQINETSRNIGNIIKVVDEIAFQTNLLALNAAVEAARAGVHGKGFAVVAEEVRNLAGRSAKAARETAELIEGSIAQIHQGSELSDSTAEQLEAIASAVARAAEITSDISTASSQQASGIAEVNTGLAQIETVTHQNTASAEQTAAAASELDGQAQRLRASVSKFRMQEDPSCSALPRGARGHEEAAWQHGPHAALPNPE